MTTVISFGNTRKKCIFTILAYRFMTCYISQLVEKSVLQPSLERGLRKLFVPRSDSVRVNISGHGQLQGNQNLLAFPLKIVFYQL